MENHMQSGEKTFDRSVLIESWMLFKNNFKSLTLYAVPFLLPQLIIGILSVNNLYPESLTWFSSLNSSLSSLVSHPRLNYVFLFIWYIFILVFSILLIEIYANQSEGTKPSISLLFNKIQETFKNVISGTVQLFLIFAGISLIPMAITFVLGMFSIDVLSNNYYVVISQIILVLISPVAIALFFLLISIIQMGKVNGKKGIKRLNLLIPQGFFRFYLYFLVLTIIETVIINLLKYFTLQTALIETAFTVIDFFRFPIVGIPELVSHILRFIFVLIYCTFGYVGYQKMKSLRRKKLTEAEESEAT
jgi:hypothetical protein